MRIVILDKYKNTYEYKNVKSYKIKKHKFFINFGRLTIFKEVIVPLSSVIKIDIFEL